MRGSTSREEPMERASCHCGRIKIGISEPLPNRVYDCNCSICTMKGYLHWFVARERVLLQAEEGALGTYTFNTRQAKHHFCTTCGVAPFYVARSHPDAIDINVRCVEGADLSRLEIVPFDGRNWEQAVESLQERTR